LKLKVYGIISIVRLEDRKDIFFREYSWRNQARYVAAVFSQKEFAKLLNCSIYFIRTYGCITHNKEEIKKALANPHKLIFINGV